jgi:hypothetical protein
MAPWGESYYSRRFGGKCCIHLQGGKKQRARENISSVSLAVFFSTLKVKATRSSEKSVLTIPARRHIPEDDVVLRHGRESIKSYIGLTGWDL